MCEGFSRVLVTGGTGFLGSRLSDRLVSEGYAVRVLSRSTHNRARLNLADKIEFFVGDIARKESIAKAFSGVDQSFTQPPERSAERRYATPLR